MTCEVCNLDGADAVFHMFPMHRSCAPKRWVKDQDNLTEFMARFHTWWATASPWKRKREG